MKIRKDGILEIQPVSAASWPLPTGAATEATLASVDSKLGGNLGTKEMPDSTSTFTPSNVSTTAYANSIMVKTSPGVLYSLSGYNSSTSPQFIQIHNSASAPVDGAVPVIIFSVPEESNFSFSADKFGRYFSNGIAICNSSTGPTLTIGASNCWFDVQFS